MKIAITGASSFIGTHLITRLSKDDVVINALTRSLNIKKHTKVNYYEGNLLEKSSLTNFLEGCDKVINLVYLWDKGLENNLKAIKNLADACVETGVKRLLHCSTTSVYGNVTVKIINEDTACNPQSDYAMTKFAMEDFLLKNYNKFFEVILIRPTQVFGPHGKNLVKFIKDLKENSVFGSYMKSWFLNKRKMNLVYIDNVVEAFNYLINKNNLNYSVYLISDDEDPDNNFGYVETMVINKLRLTQNKIPRVCLPLFFYEVIYKRIFRDKDFTTSFVNKNLTQEGYVKPVSFGQGLSNYLDWYYYENT